MGLGKDFEQRRLQNETENLIGANDVLTSWLREYPKPISPNEAARLHSQNPIFQIGGILTAMLVDRLLKDETFSGSQSLNEIYDS